MAFLPWLPLLSSIREGLLLWGPCSCFDGREHRESIVGFELGRKYFSSPVCCCLLLIRNDTARITCVLRSISKLNVFILYF